MSFNYLRTQKNFSKKMSTDWWDNFSIDSILKKRTFACHEFTSDLQIEKSYKKPSKPTLCQKQLAAPTCVRWDFSNSLALFSVSSFGSISSKWLTERGHKTDLSPWITPTQRFWLLNGGCSGEIGEAIFQPNTNERCATTNLLPLNAVQHPLLGRDLHLLLSRIVLPVIAVYNDHSSIKCVKIKSYVHVSARHSFFN